MQSCIAPPGPSMTSDTAIHEVELKQPVEGDAKSRRPLDRPAPDRFITTPKKQLRERLRRPLLIAFPLLLAAVGATYYLAEEPYVSTNDAFVRAAKELVTARVAGQVVEIAVKDNQRVKRGQLLFQVDPGQYRIAVDQAEARLATARLQVNRSPIPWPH